MRIMKSFEFQSAHFLPRVAETHRCRRVHGHSYRVDVVVSGEVNSIGWVVDFADIEAAMNPLLAQVDHHLINEVPGLENPTAENIAIWFAEALRKSDKLSDCEIAEVTVWEERTCSATWSYNNPD